MARCDGDIKLGCDSCGFVSYRDCSWDGGHCAETPDGAECEAPQVSGNPCASARSGCSGNSLTLCVNSTPITVDCIAIGMDGCTEAPPDGLFATTFCDADAAYGCPLAYCVKNAADAGASAQP
jgi:hypothetical protein